MKKETDISIRSSAAEYLTFIVAAGDKTVFAAVQNKMHFRVHGQTAAEVIYHRANAEKGHMGLTSWDGSPLGKIHKYDVTVAKTI